MSNRRGIEVIGLPSTTLRLLWTRRPTLLGAYLAARRRLTALRDGRHEDERMTCLRTLADIQERLSRREGERSVIIMIARPGEATRWMYIDDKVEMKDVATAIELRQITDQASERIES